MDACENDLRFQLKGGKICALLTGGFGFGDGPAIGAKKVNSLAGKSAGENL